MDLRTLDLHRAGATALLQFKNKDYPGHRLQRPLVDRILSSLSVA